jgi:D-sedoheptulose 7-phosphate isomerase
VSLRPHLDEHRAVAAAMEPLLPEAERVARLICSSAERGGKLVTFGNGGSAADAQHFVAELLGHFRADRRPLAAVALTVDPSVVTAISNDYAWEDVFARQVHGLVQPADIVVGISTSGSSENVVRGVAAGRERGATTVAMTGQGGVLFELADHVLAVPSQSTPRIQEMHLLLIHLMSEVIDAWALEQDRMAR